MQSGVEGLGDYKMILEEFNNYQNLAEKTIEDLNARNIELEKKLDALSNIVEISEYINSNLSDNNLISIINDMILGILGVTYSSIYLQENDKLLVKASNSNQNFYNHYSEYVLTKIKNQQVFMFNSKEKIFEPTVHDGQIHSIMGVPITLRGKFMGYIILQHTLCDFFDDDQMKFVSSIANQISIALENSFLYKKIKEASIKDPLLGIFNRKYFFSFLENIISNLPEKKFAIVMMDFDNFKRVNDVYGHQFGDEVLIQTTKLVSGLLEGNDIMARYGGEEIIIYIDDCRDYDKVYRRIDDIREAICNNEVKYNETIKSITASFGLSFYPSNANTLQNVISVADNMLYQSKKLGKNRVTRQL